MRSRSTRYLALGDSYTIGEGVDPTLRWPSQLAALLEREGVSVGDPVVVARTGWTTDELSVGIEEAGPMGPFGLVSLLIGVNNQYRGRGPGEYRAQFRSLLLRGVDLAGGNSGRVLVLSIPDWGATPFAAGRDREAIARQVDAFNEANLAESRNAGARYLDVTGISRQVAVDPTLVAEDGLHPSGAMYARWAREAMPLALEALQGELRGKEAGEGREDRDEKGEGGRGGDGEGRGDEEAGHERLG